MAIKHVVFISLPMAGKTEEELKEDIQKAKESYFAVRPEMDPKEVAFISGLDNEEPPEWMEDYDKQSLWYLGQSIKKLSKCDEAFFYGKWDKFRGCQIEATVCEKYGVPATRMISESVMIDIATQ